MPGKLAARVRGLSEGQFRAAFGTEAQCRAVLERLRWPKGFICPSCGHGGRAWLAERQLYQCNRCKHQVSLTAGTMFHATKLPLITWFLAIHLIVTAKNGISSVELGRRLGVKQTTAWVMKQKIMQVMREREARKPLRGRVEVDDAYLGGARRGGKRGRGAAGKTPLVAAVETTAERRPQKLKLLPVKGFRKREVEKLARRHLQPGSNVVSDGLTCWTAVATAGCRHFPMRTGSGKQAAQWMPFKWVNTMLGNIKAAITGTYRQLSPAHAPRYLASFAWRFNRRFQLDTMMPRFLHSAARTQPLPYRLLIAG
jgi:ISXO2-like transposase domain/Transposase zinc-ribbon domain